MNKPDTLPQPIPECKDCGEPLSLLELRDMQCTECGDAEFERMRQQAAEEAAEDRAREAFEDLEIEGHREPDYGGASASERLERDAFDADRGAR